MLILDRRPGETIRIGDDIRVKLLYGGRGGRNVRIGIEAPASVPVHREEIYERIRRAGMVSRATAGATKAQDPPHG